MGKAKQPTTTIADCARWMKELGEDLGALLRDIDGLVAAERYLPLQQNKVEMTTSHSLKRSWDWFPTELGRGYAQLPNKRSMKKVDQTVFFEICLAPEFGPDDACVISAKLTLPHKLNRKELKNGWLHWFSDTLAEFEINDLDKPIPVPSGEVEERYPAFAGGKIVCRVVELTKLKDEAAVQKLLVGPVLKGG